MSATEQQISSSLRFVYACLVFFTFSLPSSTLLAAVPSWQGPYLGIYLGSGFGNNHLASTTGLVTSTSYFATAADINAVNNAASGTSNPNTVIAGIQAGHDWIWKQMVYGVVADYGALPLTASKSLGQQTYPDNSNQYSVATSISTHWLFTLRGRVGYQTMQYWPSLIYLTGGMAITQLNINNHFSDNSPYAGIGGTNTAENQLGWTAGVGIELFTFAHASIDIEYLYIHMPSVKTSSSIYNTQAGFGVPVQSLRNPFSSTGQMHANLLKIALNYRFDE
jgi:outer membrane immunogenic protein